MGIGKIPARKISEAREVTARACEEAFESASDRRACRMGSELMVTALSGQEAIEMGRTPKGFRETQSSRIHCAEGSMRTLTPNKNTRVVVCCPRGPGHYKRGRCAVGMRMKATFKRA